MIAYVPLGNLESRLLACIKNPYFVHVKIISSSNSRSCTIQVADVRYYVSPRQLSLLFSIDKKISIVFT